MFTDNTSNRSIFDKYIFFGGLSPLNRSLLRNAFKPIKYNMDIKTGNKKSILIVDDELSILKLLGFILSAEYELIIKKSGIEAIAWLEEGNDPDLIISDLMMPYFDGSTLIRNLKISGFYRNTPVILLSGAEDLADRVQEMQFKIDSYLEKPFNPTVLKTKIAELIA